MTMRSLLHRYQRVGGACCLQFQLESGTATQSETSHIDGDYKYREETCLFNGFLEINTTEQTSYNNHHQCVLLLALSSFFRGRG